MSTPFYKDHCFQHKNWSIYAGDPFIQVILRKVEPVWRFAYVKGPPAVRVQFTYYWGWSLCKGSSIYQVYVLGDIQG